MYFQKIQYMEWICNSLDSDLKTLLKYYSIYEDLEREK